MTTPLRILLISGSTRDSSTNTAALRTIAAEAPADLTATLYAGLVELPQFVPGLEPEPANVEALHKQLADSDAVLICTPEYAGMIPGSLKNLLEWTVGTGDLMDKPVAWINVAYPGRGDAAVETLSTVLGYVSADIVEVACGRITVLREQVGADGLVEDDQARQRLSLVLPAIAAHVREKAA
ncbi:NAD(P)H-dependent oxidoreductase [Nocardia sp. NBC_01503]|uniref:NADPH-dependent FMN reductase n=1 Tax=Nocardia sp. NBC_01503 TaxID=2975997 RepID=UPI002E7AFEDF|nr:NADPH-dependent FMN reductase [Nocardia sp. NBC_01503]WTL33534.1 NAD(P)H-dependent oxidoreductase [Nocardia sp. NBC_01503]